MKPILSALGFAVGLIAACVGIAGLLTRPELAQADGTVFAFGVLLALVCWGWRGRR